GEAQSVEGWGMDLASPGLMRVMKKKLGAELERAGTPFKFAPEEGPAFFTRHGWRPADVRSMLKTARRLKRLPFVMWLISMLPEGDPRPPSRPWSGLVLREKPV